MHLKNLSILVPLVLTSALGASCISLRANYKAKCEWLEVEVRPDVTASGTRRLGQGHTPPHGCGTADTFTLSRPRYAIEVWNSEEISPVLYLRVASSDVGTLDLRSPDLISTAVGGRAAHYEKGMRFQHVFYGHSLTGEKPQARHFPYLLTVEVVDERGTVVGTESIRVVKRSGLFRFNEF